MEIPFSALLWYTIPKNGGMVMDWDLKEALAYYKKLGAPADQNALIALLREVQRQCGGSVPQYMVREAAESYGVKESLLLALIRRIPSLRLADTHVLEICAGPNCSKGAALAEAAETLCAGKKISVKSVPCMRMCGRGPNIRWDGTVHHGADGALIKELVEEA